MIKVSRETFLTKVSREKAICLKSVERYSIKVSIEIFIFDLRSVES